jgi:hypothetical protein
MMLLHPNFQYLEAAASVSSSAMLVSVMVFDFAHFLKWHLLSSA